MGNAVDEIISIPGFNDPFSSISHLLGAGIFAILFMFLLRRRRGDRERMISLAVFCVAAVFLLSMRASIYQIADGHVPSAGQYPETACPT